MKKLYFNFFKTNVIKRLFLGFLLVSIPFYAISLVVISFASKTVFVETQKSTSAQMQFFINYFEDEMRNVNQMIITLNNDSDISSFYLQQKSGVFNNNVVMLYRNIKSKMKAIFYSSDYITDVFLLLPDMNKQLSLLDGDTSINKQNMTILDRQHLSSRQINRFVQGESLTYTIAFPNIILDNTPEAKTEINYLLGVNISQNQIIQSLKKFNNNKKYHLFLVENRDGSILGQKILTELDKQVYTHLSEIIVKHEVATLTLGGKEYLLQSGATSDGAFTLYSYALKNEIISPLLQFTRLLWLILASSVVMFFIFSVLVYRQIRRPLSHLVKLMKEVEKGNFDVVFNRPQEDEFGYVYNQFNRMVVQVKILIEEVLEKKKQVHQAEMKQLQSQINPHFLFNCFYLGYRMAKAGDNENVAKLCKYLGDYFRFINKNSQHEIQLRDEVNYTVTYLDIQKLRFSKRLEYRIEFDEELGDTKVPGLILQPVVENSIIHGIEKVNCTGSIFIKIKAQEDTIHFEVWDNGKGMSEGEMLSLSTSLESNVNDSEHCGLWNVHQRLCGKFGIHSGLKFDNLVEGGLRVAFTIPKY